ncbi:MAG: bifunctional phosphopantothenoylcysteine decarboxylase/phosphopantothenate--cysteine ligase CoaBC [Peptococcaceae bacterium]|nr:bifunctional phosphopantothenoylcysteine decarboxylase/phosphopantothenate--cysteine ligase CoaBC [Peptococcaceae bacterium]
MFKGKNIVVGVTGSIAAYKSAELVSLLKKKEARVYCVMTQAAREFITPLTLRTLSQNPVFTGMFDEPRLWKVEHVGLADSADLVMVVPATANIIGKLCHGIADDLLTTVIMAAKAPVLLAPAMNVNMYMNPIVIENIKKLKEFGYHFVEPEEGELACGYQGKGRLADLETILERAEELLVKERPLCGKKVLVTAGPTREPLDPVRFLTNHSTGKMGYAIARQGRLLGADVTLVSGPSALRPFSGVKLIKVETAQEMKDAVISEYENSDIIIKAAAVGDFRPKTRSVEKIKKQSAGGLCLELENNPDILAELGQRKGSRILVGFAAETTGVIKNAAEKIAKKNLDFIVANDITKPGAGFAGDTNQVTLIFADGREKKLPLMEKDSVAREILEEATRILKERECMLN